MTTCADQHGSSQKITWHVCWYLGCGDLLDLARVTSPDESGDGGSRGDLPTALEEEGMHGVLEARPESEEAHQGFDEG